MATLSGLDLESVDKISPLELQIFDVSNGMCLSVKVRIAGLLSYG